MAKNELMVNISTLLTQHGDSLKAMGIDATTFTSMAVAKRVRELKASKKDLETKIAALREEHSTVSKHIAVLAEDLVEAKCKAYGAAFKTFASAIGIKKPAVTHSGVNVLDGFVCTTVHFNHEGGSYGISKEEKIALTAVLKSNLAALNKISAEQGLAQNELNDVRCKLQDIGNLERDANAQIAHKMLSGSEEGRKILDAMGLADLG